MSPSIKRHELSDEEWALIKPLLPPQKTRGRSYIDHRTVLNGMLYWFHTGVPWRDLPERYGRWQTVYSRYLGVLKLAMIRKYLKLTLSNIP